VFGVKYFGKISIRDGKSLKIAEKIAETGVTIEKGGLIKGCSKKKHASTTKGEPTLRQIEAGKRGGCSFHPRGGKKLTVYLLW